VREVARKGEEEMNETEDDIRNLEQRLEEWHTMALKNIEGVQGFQRLVFEATQALLSTKGFTKSKSIKNIRETLEKRSKEILAKINS
ncbi:MAG: hypothetical protein Q7K28_01890, partial [Candidatus Wildermuthbacteria bacterium]|nr:hypothetical protein [Candidatus Wildermuthbacteria bacterium]